MAGKPELSVSQQTQAQGVQNVVVYVSNDNIAQAYATAVGQQHIGTQNGLVYGGQAQPPSNYPKGIVNKTLVKQNDVNGLIDGGFYQNATSAIIPQNGFAQNIQSFQNNVNQTGQVLNSSYSGTAVKNVIGFNGSVGEVYPTSGITKQKSGRDDSGSVVENYVAAQSADGSFVTVMGAEATGGTASVVFPRCDSVRSEAAESSCSSLSSGDSPGDGVASSGFVLLPSNGPQPPSDVVVYEGSVSVRPGQPLVLAMVPPGSVPQQQLEVTIIPLGWKRLISNGVVIYISPSNAVLSSMDQIKEYLMTQGTCKCGLECPLKCDTVFNFDPKIVGKPCTLTPDMNIGDLTKLCNHKRKLLAMTCSASSPTGAVAGALTVGAGGMAVFGSKSSTPTTGMAGSNPSPGNGINITTTTPSPPDPNKLLRKDGSIKRKKRKMGGPYSGISVSQLLAQREKMAMAQQPILTNNQSMQQQIWSGISNSQSISIPQQNSRVGNFVDPTNGQVLRYQPQNQNRVVSSSPMMINNTMIAQGNHMQQQQLQHQLNQNIQTQQQLVQQHMQHQAQPIHHQQLAQQNINQQQMQSNQLHFQQNIIGPNGQVITVQQQSQGNTPQGQINVGSMNMITHPDVVMQNDNIMRQQRIVMGGPQDDTQSTINRQIQHVGMPMNSNNASVQQQEMIQRLQQQHQIINQSMHAGQARAEDQSKMLQQFESKNIRQFVPIGNSGAPSGAVFNIRSEGMSQTSNNQNISNTIGIPQHKTPPWQQNKINNIQQNTIQHQNQQTIISQQQINQQSVQQNIGNIYERVPPLHHHTPSPPVWSDDTNRKKNKISKTTKKQRPYNIMEHHQRTNNHEGHLACPNIDVRQIPGEHHRSNQQLSQEISSPSFMEDPSGYLAQQTALLNSTISRQTGINNGGNFLCRQGPVTPPQNNSQIPSSQSAGSPVAVPLPSNMIQQQPKQIQCYSGRNSINLINNNKIQQNVISPLQSNVNNGQAEINSPVNSMIQPPDCQSCVTTSQIPGNQYQHYASKIQNEQQKLYQISRPNSHPSTPSNSISMKDDPVTSSNYNDKFNNVISQQSLDLRPIQGATISTSDGSPLEFRPQSSSPSPSSSVKNSSTPNPILSNSSPHFVIPSHHSPGLYTVGTSRNPSSSYSQTVPHSLTMTISTNDQNIQKSHNYSMQSSPTTSLNLPVSQNKAIEGYCPPPHAVGGNIDLPMPYQPRTVTTMASGRTFGSNTITSVLAGRAQTATVSVNTPTVIPTLGMPNTSSFQQNVQCPQASNSTNISKSPLEMVQSVVSSIQVPHSQNTLSAININTNQTQMSPQQIVKSTPSQGLPPSHILVSSGGGQLIMTNNGQATMMPPPPPKIVTNTSGMPPMSVSSLVTNVTGAVTQVIPTVGMAQQVLGQQTVLVNALPGPFVIQPSVMAVDGMTVGQNMQLPQIVTGNVIQHQIQLENNGEQSRPPSQGFTNRPPTLISPDGGKRKGKKRKMGSQTVASMLHVAAQQNSGVVMQQQAGFSPQGFQMAHSPQGVNTGPVLQALTIVPGKGGAPPQIVMNGQASATSPFGTQQLIANSQPTQQINLLQPVNLLNNTTGMVQNFPTIQQFIVPGLGGMVMATDGSGTATLLPETQSVGMQLQLQNLNGQNVLTPVQNHGNAVFGTTGGQSILAAGPAGMVIRTPASSQGKLIQQQHSPGAQFLSPNGGQFVMNGAQFNGQLSPLVASVSPSQQVTVRPNSSVPQEFIQCGQMGGQTLMVPCTPSNPQTIAVSSASNQQNTTFVQQNTTIVQQQTTMVSNNPQIQNFANGNQNVVSNTQNVNSSSNGMNIDQNFVINNNGQSSDSPKQNTIMQQPQQSMNAALLMQRHSVSTQTAVGQSSTVGTTVSAGAGSPPDTTTHSPLAPGADTTTHEGTSPSPPNCSILREHPPTHSMAMVHCVSSSEPDAADMSTEWSRCSSAGSATPKSADCTDFTLLQTNSHFGNGQSRKSLTPTYVESTVSIMNEVNIKAQDTVVSSQKSVKRKHSDALVMETRQMRSSLQDDDTDESRSSGPGSPVVFTVGDLVWGAARGCPAWPGKLVDGPNSRDGRIWVRWFGGDRTPMAVNPATLQTLTQGLDAHHRARKKCRKSRKLNTQLENAIQEAMTELDHMSEQHPENVDGSVSPQTVTKSHIEMKSSVTQSPFKKDMARLRSSQK